MAHLRLSTFVLVVSIVVSGAGIAQTKYPFVEIRRLGGAEHCPVYDVFVYDDGSVAYVGYHGVNHRGPQSATLSKPLTEKVRERFDASGFLSMKAAKSNARRTSTRVYECSDASVQSNPRLREACQGRRTIEITVGAVLEGGGDVVVYRRGGETKRIDAGRAGPGDRGVVEDLMRYVEGVVDAKQWTGREPC